MKNKIKKIILYLFTAVVLFFPVISFAQGIGRSFGEGSPLEDVRGKLGYKSAAQGGDVGTIVGQVINTALTLVGITFLVLMVYAGYLWMTARGEENQITKAKDILKSTIIGLVLVLSAYAITVFVTSGLNK